MRKIQQLNNERGAAHLVAILVVLVLLGVGFAGWRVMNKKDEAKPASKTQNSQQDDTASKMPDMPGELVWQQTASGWTAMQTPPSCPDTLELALPVDIAKVSSILYPGQVRGEYKPHGGFRLDGKSNAITIKAPIEGYIVRGGQYLAEGEIQYTFDVMNNCGVMYRVGHLRELPANLQELTKSWPAAQEGDSRTHGVNPAVAVKKGDVLATSVGIIKDKNVFFDWGVYDYRKQNEASASAAYQQAHMQDKELSWHAVCWLDWLSKSDEAKVRVLPAGDPTSGKKSDYCK